MSQLIAHAAALKKEPEAARAPSLNPVRYLGPLTETLTDDVIYRKGLGEGTLYLFYQDAQKQRLSFFSPGLQRKIEESYFRNLAANTFFMDRFFKTYGEITRAYPTILLKGISLLNTVYTDPGMRHLGDLDLLIQEKDYAAIRRLLEEKGYEFNDQMLSVADPESFHSVMCRPRDADPGEPFIHLHWHWLNTMLPVSLCQPTIDLASIWRDAAPLASHPHLRVMSPAHQIIFYAYHHLKHSFDRLIRLHDLDQTIRFYGSRLDWDALISEAERFNLSRHIFFPLSAAERFLGSPIPGTVLSKLRPAELSSAEIKILAAVERGEKPSYAHAFIYLGMQPNLWKKIVFLYRSFVPAVKLTRASDFFYLVRRGARGIGIALRSLYEQLVSKSEKEKP